jgi:exosortase A-associated hydrolase 2
MNRESFYFCEATNQLLGVYHPAALDCEREHGIVLCYPFASEYIRTHRLFVYLANKLAETGFHVLRFDYFGTGDSAGELTEASTDIWLDNIRSAAEELRESAGVSVISLMGMRLGATLAALAAHSDSSFENLIIWDPVFNGETFLQALSSQHQEWLIQHLLKPQSAQPQQEVIGFPLSKQLANSINKLDLSCLAAPPVPRTLLLFNQSPPALPAWSAAATTIVIEEGQVWQTNNNLENFLVPNKSINAILNWLNEVCP